MIKLNDLRAPRGANRKIKRVGRGSGSGHGKTSTRGHKGQKARSGPGIGAWFEGGQMPLQRRVPKRGFTNIFRKEYQVVNLEDLDGFAEGSSVDAQALAAAGLVKHVHGPIKLLARGSVTKALQIKVSKASKAATEAVTAAGGTVVCEE